MALCHVVLQVSVSFRFKAYFVVACCVCWELEQVGACGLMKGHGVHGLSDRPPDQNRQGIPALLPVTAPAILLDREPNKAPL